MDDELKKAIKAGASLKKVDPNDLKAHEDEKAKRMAELKKLAEKLEKEAPKE